MAARLGFLFRVVEREAAHLRFTADGVFSEPFTVERARALADMPRDAERVEAFVARFARLQDTVGDKLIPAMLGALGEPLRAAVDNLDRAERLGWVASVDEWMAARQLRNRMVHEYVEDPKLLCTSLMQGEALVPMLLAAAEACRAEGGRRGWLASEEGGSAA